MVQAITKELLEEDGVWCAMSRPTTLQSLEVCCVEAYHTALFVSKRQRLTNSNRSFQVILTPTSVLVTLSSFTLAC